MFNNTLRRLQQVEICQKMTLIIPAGANVCECYVSSGRLLSRNIPSLNSQRRWADDTAREQVITHPVGIIDHGGNDPKAVVVNSNQHPLGMLNGCNGRCAQSKTYTEKNYVIKIISNIFHDGKSNIGNQMSINKPESE